VEAGAGGEEGEGNESKEDFLGKKKKGIDSFGAREKMLGSLEARI